MACSTFYDSLLFICRMSTGWCVLCRCRRILYDPCVAFLIVCSLFWQVIYHLLSFQLPPWVLWVTVTCGGRCGTVSCLILAHSSNNFIEWLIRKFSVFLVFQYFYNFFLIFSRLKVASWWYSPYNYCNLFYAFNISELTACDSDFCFLRSNNRAFPSQILCTWLNRVWKKLLEI